MNNFENAKVGDTVLVTKNSGFKSYRVKSSIEKVTKTEITADGTRYKKDSGRAVGSSGWNIEFIYPYSEEKDQTAQYREHLLKSNAANCAKRIVQNSNDLSPDDARLIIDIWERTKKAGATND